MNENATKDTNTPEAPMRNIAEAISEVERELLVRKRCYGRWVDDGKMSRIDAVDRYARLQSALAYLRAAEGTKDSATEADRSVDDNRVPF